jgi:hypothetical protein
MSRGRVNPFFLRYLQAKRGGEAVFQRLIAEARAQGAI